MSETAASSLAAIFLGRRKHMVPQRVIIVEDEYLVALDVEAVLQSMGVETVVIATTLAQARQAVEEDGADCVLLDVSLTDGKSYDFARGLRDGGIPFGFVSGYGDTTGFPDDLMHAPLLGKPFGENEIIDFVLNLVGTVDDAVKE
ncbi:MULTISPECIES: response regulator [Agrobacterium tumefaciens complex]|jgi:DNA-binding response OmpR family regulator|uniref:response regulator n=2 Tax=Rhizobium/Agrobacterium group TaxID=227290 RepID=UPI001E5F3DBC|nr:response regulator [Agrobacterium tumefaciens]